MGKDKIFIVSDKRDQVYNLTDVIPAMVKAEKVTEEWAIDYFMHHLEGSKYMKFPANTSMSVIVEWVVESEDNNTPLI